MKNRKKNNFPWFVVVLLIFVIGGFFIWKESGQSSCMVCGRGVCQSLRFGLNDGWKHIRTCCPQCGLDYIGVHPRSSADVATDFNTGKEIKAGAAYYVHDSDVILCHKMESVRDDLHGESAFTRYDRCLPSLIAFEARNDAEEFRKAHGGTVLTFDQLLIYEKARIGKGV